MTVVSSQRRRLPDQLRAGVRILFVGINPGVRSAAVGHHFAGPSNRFWKLLFESGLVGERLTYEQDWKLPEWGLGLTNIIGRSSVGIAELTPEEYRAGLGALVRKIRRYRPRTVALLGVTIYRVLFTDGNRQGLVAVGPTKTRLAGVPLFVLPNPSGRNAHYSYQEMLRIFILLRTHTHASARTPTNFEIPLREHRP
jgi:TDG/mug DNA glycosylase family protein